MQDKILCNPKYDTKLHLKRLPNIVINQIAWELSYSRPDQSILNQPAAQPKPMCPIPACAKLT